MAHRGNLRLMDDLRGGIDCSVLGDEFLRGIDSLGCDRLGGSTNVRRGEREPSDHWGNDVIGDNYLTGFKTGRSDKRRIYSSHGRDDGVSWETRLRRSKIRGRGDRRRMRGNHRRDDRMGGGTRLRGSKIRGNKRKRRGNHRRDDVMGGHYLRGFKNGGRNNKRMRFVDDRCKKGLNGWNRLRFFENRRRNGERWFMNHGGNDKFVGYEHLRWSNNRRSDGRRVNGRERRNIGVVLGELNRLGR